MAGVTEVNLLQSKALGLFTKASLTASCSTRVQSVTARMVGIRRDPGIAIETRTHPGGVKEHLFVKGSGCADSANRDIGPRRSEVQRVVYEFDYT
jgi:hypothetical protein